MEGTRNKGVFERCNNPFLSNWHFPLASYDTCFCVGISLCHVFDKASFSGISLNEKKPQKNITLATNKIMASFPVLYIYYVQNKTKTLENRWKSRKVKTPRKYPSFIVSMKRCKILEYCIFCSHWPTGVCLCKGSNPCCLSLLFQFGELLPCINLLYRLVRTKVLLLCIKLHHATSATFCCCCCCCCCCCRNHHDPMCLKL